MGHFLAGGHFLCDGTFWRAHTIFVMGRAGGRTPQRSHEAFLSIHLHNTSAWTVTGFRVQGGRSGFHKGLGDVSAAGDDGQCACGDDGQCACGDDGQCA
eukprot:364179-Chlamydomonas_euryale.AAC.5